MNMNLRVNFEKILTELSFTLVIVCLPSLQMCVIPLTGPEWNTLQDDTAHGRPSAPRQGSRRTPHRCYRRGSSQNSEHNEERVMFCISLLYNAYESVASTDECIWAMSACWFSCWECLTIWNRGRAILCLAELRYAAYNKDLCLARVLELWFSLPLYPGHIERYAK